MSQYQAGQPVILPEKTVARRIALDGEGIVLLDANGRPATIEEEIDVRAAFMGYDERGRIIVRLADGTERAYDEQEIAPA